MALTRHALADHGAAEVDIGVRGPKGERLCWYARTVQGLTPTLILTLTLTFTLSRYECTVQGGRKGSDIDVVQLATSSNPNPNPNPDPDPKPKQERPAQG